MVSGPGTLLPAERTTADQPPNIAPSFERDVLILESSAAPGGRRSPFPFTSMTIGLLPLGGMFPSVVIVCASVLTRTCSIPCDHVSLVTGRLRPIVKCPPG